MHLPFQIRLTIDVTVILLSPQSTRHSSNIELGFHCSSFPAAHPLNLLGQHCAMPIQTLYAPVISYVKHNFCCSNGCCSSGRSRSSRSSSSRRSIEALVAVGTGAVAEVAAITKVIVIVVAVDVLVVSNPETNPR